MKIMIKLFEVHCFDVPQNDKRKIYQTFKKKWSIREIWVNPSQVVSITDYEMPDEVIVSLPKDLLKNAGFSNINVTGGYNGSSILAVGNPRFVAEKILEFQ